MTKHRIGSNLATVRGTYDDDAATLTLWVNGLRAVFSEDECDDMLRELDLIESDEVLSVLDNSRLHEWQGTAFIREHRIKLEELVYGTIR